MMPKTHFHPSNKLLAQLNRPFSHAVAVALILWGARSHCTGSYLMDTSQRKKYTTRVIEFSVVFIIQESMEADLRLWQHIDVR